MKVGIIGAGFTGLSAAYELSKLGHEVKIFELDKEPGGLALGYQEKNWEWGMEKHYHHWFTNDKFILGLAKEIEHKIIIKRPKTSIFVKDHIYQFDSPKEVLMFPLLSLLDRIRMGLVIGLIKFDPFWKHLEKFNATIFLPKYMGKKGYQMIWDPLFKNKFGPYANDISLAWFWARIVKRTPSLAYPEGGFLNFARDLVKAIEKKNGKFYFGSQVLEVSSDPKPSLKYQLQDGEVKQEDFDSVIVTLPSFLFIKLGKGLSENYMNRFARLKGLGATNLVLRMKQPFFKDGTYWLSVCDPESPVMAIVEHTNFMDKKHYDNEHLLYLGNYLPADSQRFSMNADETLKLFDPFLQKINLSYKQNLISYELFKAPFAQPIIPTNYSKLLPPFETPLNNVYLANIEQVYPWDRGTNYAVELGQKIVNFVLKNDRQ